MYLTQINTKYSTFTFKNSSFFTPTCLRDVSFHVEPFNTRRVVHPYWTEGLTLTFGVQSQWHTHTWEDISCLGHGVVAGGIRSSYMSTERWPSFLLFLCVSVCVCVLVSPCHHYREAYINSEKWLLWGPPCHLCRLVWQQRGITWLSVLPEARMSATYRLGAGAHRPGRDPVVPEVACLLAGGWELGGWGHRPGRDKSRDPVVPEVACRLGPRRPEAVT